MKKIVILFLLFIAYGINVSAQVFYNYIVFKGGFQSMDTVYIFTRKENVKYTIAFDSVNIMMQPLVGLMRSVRIPEVRKFTIIYQGKKYKKRNNSPSKQFTVIKSKRKRLVIKKQKKQVYL